MRYPSFAILLALVVLLATVPVVAETESEGLAELDKAVEEKLAVRSLDQLSRVIDRLQAALNKGLDEPTSVFARNLLAETLMERASILTKAIFERNNGGRDTQIRMWNIALSDLKRVVKIDENHAEAHFFIGRLQVRSGNYGEAREALDAAIGAVDAAKSIRAQALALRGNLQTDDEQRLADYNQAVELAPDDANVIRTRGMFYWLQGKTEEAIDDLSKAVSLDPSHAATHEARGVALLLKGEYDSALESIDKAIELAPDAPSAYMHRGRVLVLNGEVNNALLELEKSLQISPGYLPALRLRAEIWAGTGRLNEAIASLKRLAEARPKDVELSLQLGRYYLSGRQFRRAIEAFERVVSINNQQWEALQMRADALLAVGDQSEAITDYESALKVQPEKNGILNNLAWVLATSPHDDLRNGNRALDLATKACENTDYQEAHILSTLAAAYAELGQFGAAVEWSEKAVLRGEQMAQERMEELGEEKDLEAAKQTFQLDQLTKELESYREEKPWREMKSDNDDVPEEQDPAQQPSQTTKTTESQSAQRPKTEDRRLAAP